MVTAAKWLKKDIRFLCGILDTFVLVNRPHHSPMMFDRELDARARTYITDKLTKHRKDVVLAGIRSARNTSSERYSSDCGVIGNEIVRFGKTTEDERIKELVKSAREEDAAGKRLEEMLHRIYHGELPPEVESYDPIAAAKW